MILLVEDETIIAMGTTMILEDAGFDVRVAPNGEEGLRLAIELAPDLIMSDYMMPRMDGLKMIEELRLRGVTTPIVLATSIPEGNIMKGSHRSYDAYLGKPYQEQATLEIVRHLLATRA